VPSYCHLIGRLLYLTITRSENTFGTQVSHLLQILAYTHFHVAQRVLRYLNTFLGRGLSFPRSSSLQFFFCNCGVDWGG